MDEHVGQQAVMICMCVTHMGLLCGSYRGGDHWVVAFVGVRHNKIPDSKTLTGLYPVSHTNLKGANTSTSGTWIKRRSFLFSLKTCTGVHLSSVDVGVFTVLICRRYWQEQRREGCVWESDGLWHVSTCFTCYLPLSLWLVSLYGSFSEWTHKQEILHSRILTMKVCM